MMETLQLARGNTVVVIIYYVYSRDKSLIDRTSSPSDDEEYDRSRWVCVGGWGGRRIGRCLIFPLRPPSPHPPCYPAGNRVIFTDRMIKYIYIPIWIRSTVIRITHTHIYKAIHFSFFVFRSIFFSPEPSTQSRLLLPFVIFFFFFSFFYRYLSILTGPRHRLLMWS